jgi:hypothetical protein
MTAQPQWWDSTKTSQITSEQTDSVAAGNTLALDSFWLFNDKGSLLGATSMTGYRLVLEAFDGVSWVRGGMPLLDEGWVQVQITAKDSTGGAITDQITTWASIGAGRSVSLTDIPAGCGRKIETQVIVPLGASESSPRWRIVEEVSASTGTISIPTGTTVTAPPVTSTLTGKVANDVALATQAASIGTTNLLASAPAGRYRVSWTLQLTQAATTSSSILATIGWNNGSAKNSTLASLNGGALQVTADASNTLDSTLSGSIVIQSAASQDITYATTYASSGATPMQYSLQITIERLQ